MERTFTVEKTTVEEGLGGRFTGRIPYQAAKKAGRALLKLSNKRQVKFTLREMTQDSKKKEFTYTVTKVKLDTPKTIQRGPVQLTVTHEYLVKAC